MFMLVFYRKYLLKLRKLIVTGTVNSFINQELNMDAELIGAGFNMTQYKPYNSEAYKA